MGIFFHAPTLSSIPALCPCWHSSSYHPYLLHRLLIIINKMSIKSTGSAAILLFLACIAIAIFYIAVSNDDDGSVVGQDDNSSSNLRQLSLIDPKTIIGKSTDTNCNHVLVTSIGGVGSSKFVGRKFLSICRT